MADTVRTDIMETTTQDTFTYDLVPLHDPSTSIRLLRLHPAQSFADDLECELYTRPLGDMGEYYALSYVWGENGKSHEISVFHFPQGPRDHDPGRTCAKLRLPITASLDICLRHLRSLYCSGDHALIIWIDQICIDQDSGGEKSHQVRLMKNIYSAAHMVLAWLGPPDDHSDEVMDTWSQISEIYLQTEASESSLLDDSPQPWLIDLYDEAVELYDRICTPQKLGKWNSRDWFTRVWIIQEFCLCRSGVKLVCGDKVVCDRTYVASLVLIITACVSFPQRFSKSPTLANRAKCWGDRYQGWVLESLIQPFRHRPLSLLRTQYVVDHERLSLLDLLVKLYPTGPEKIKATHYRDRVYGLLGLASDADDLDIMPEYSTTGTAEVLTQIARAIIERGRRGPDPGSSPPLSVLRYAQFPKAELDDTSQEVTNPVPLPTWVPDWRNGLTVSFETYWSVQPYKPSENCVQPELIPTSNSNVLGLRGYVVDTIERKAACSPLQWILNWYPLSNSIRDLWLLSYNKKTQIYQTALRHEESLWRTPIADICTPTWDIISNNVSDNGRGARRAISADIDQYRQYEEIMRKVEQEENKDTQFKMFWEQALPLSYGRRLKQIKGKMPYMTEKGYLGMGPAHAEPGDVVVVFYGDRVAYVIRPAPEHGENTYTLVGESYCDGIMDGEIADTAEKRDFFLV